MSSDLSGQRYLIDLGSMFSPLRWCWYARTANCEDREFSIAPPARDLGHTYLAGFETEEASRNWGVKEGWL